MMKINEIFFMLILVLFCSPINCLADTDYNSCIDVDNNEVLYKQIISGEKKITYECFGAIGNGKTNDYKAIKKAHDFANDLYVDKGIILTVYGTRGSTYYISEADSSIDIYTNVDWNNANFIFDDYIDETTEIKTTNAIFRITSPFNSTGKSYIGYTTEDADIINMFKSFGTSTTNIKSFVDYVINDSNITGKQKLYLKSARNWNLKVKGCEKDKVYIRRGVHADSGEVMQDNIIINSKNGDIKSPINWNYSCVNYVLVYPVPETTIEIKNGIFTTYTNNVVYGSDGKRKSYVQRNIVVDTTGNVSLKNIVHYLNEEKHKYSSDYQTEELGNEYYGFIKILDSSYVDLKDIKLSAHSFASKVVDGGISSTVKIGTYDIVINNSLNINLDNINYACNGNSSDCYYENIINKSTRWGIIATNDSKNIKVSNSILNRFDAHKGINNLYIENTTIGSRGLTLTGWGYFYGSDIKFDNANDMITLRSDYGSTWNGDMILSNSTMIYPSSTNNANLMYSNYYDEEHNFGYYCYFPNIYVDNLKIDLSNNNSNVNLFLIKLRSLDNAGNTKDDRYLYYFKDYAYFNNIKYTNNNYGNTYLFDDSFAKNDYNFNVSNYGASNKYNIVYTNIDNIANTLTSGYNNNITDGSVNSKFTVNSGITLDNRYNNIKASMLNFFDKLENIKVYKSDSNILVNNVEIINGTLTEKFDINKNSYTIITSDDNFDIKFSLADGSYVDEWDYNLSKTYETAESKVITVNVYGVYGGQNQYQFKILKSGDNTLVNPKTGFMWFYIVFIIALLSFVCFNVYYKRFVAKGNL